METLGVLLSFIAVASVTQSCYWNYFCENNDHSMCKHSQRNFGLECKEIIYSGVKRRTQKVIVAYHNTIRRKIAYGLEMRGKCGQQPPAANMSLMQWDPELAAIAQTWANQCHFGHDSCRNVDRFKVGQNVGAKRFTLSRQPVDNKWIEIMHDWYNEVWNYDKRDIYRYRRKENVIGHYTQMIWAETNRIGCGFVSFKTNSMFFPYTELYVCNYGCTGNVLGKPVYIPGRPCSLCQRGCYRGLCL